METLFLSPQCIKPFPQKGSSFLGFRFDPVWSCDLRSPQNIEAKHETQTLKRTWGQFGVPVGFSLSPMPISLL